MANEKRLIDANALLKELDKFINPTPDANGLHFLSGLYTAITEIENAPTVDAVEVVHGRWIDDAVEGFSPFTDSPIWIDVMQCSACKEYIDGSHPENYCPNCGAKMDGEKKDSNLLFADMEEIIDA